MRPRVFAAGSLRPAFTHLPGATYTFANARELAQRIAGGEPADVLATPGTSTRSACKHKVCSRHPRSSARTGS